MVIFGGENSDPQLKTLIKVSFLLFIREVGQVGYLVSLKKQFSIVIGRGGLLVTFVVVF